MHVQSNFYYLVNNRGELIKESFLCAHQSNEEHAPALAPGEKVSSTCCFYPAGREKKQRLQFKGCWQGQTSKARPCYWMCSAETCIYSGWLARAAWTHDASQLRKLLMEKLERISQRERGRRPSQRQSPRCQSYSVVGPARLYICLTFIKLQNDIFHLRLLNPGSL